LTSLDHTIREDNSVISDPGDTVTCRSRLNANRSFEVFAPTDFLAAITQHIPDKGAQMPCYYACADRLSALAQDSRPNRRTLPGDRPWDPRPGTASPISAKVPGRAAGSRPAAAKTAEKRAS
jgi:hypothetical protein